MALQPKPIQVTPGIELTPTLSVSQLYDDNVYEANDDVLGDTASWTTVVSPHLLFNAIQGKNNYQLSYSFDSEYLWDDTDNNNTDHHLHGIAVIGINASNRIEFSAGYDRVENVFDTENFGQNDKFEVSEVGAVYGIGTRDTRLSADLGVHHRWFRSRNEGVNYLHREYDNLGFTATGYYQVLPKTRLLLEYNHDDYEYQWSPSELDSERDRIFAGVTWTATARTQGTVKLGWEDREFDAARRDDNSGFAWEVNVSMQPTKNDAVSLSSFQGTTEGAIEEDYVDTSRYTVNWTRQLNPRTSSDLYYSFADNEYQDQFNREDELSKIGGEVRYALSQRVSVGVGYEYQDRESNISARSYDRNMLLFNVDMGL